MKTIDPPTKRKHKSMTAVDDDSYILQRAHTYPAARRAAVLSIVPGLGQFRNGDVVKGTLFLAVALSNVIIIASICCGNQMAPALTSLAASFQREPNWTLAAPYQNGLHGSPAVFIYFALLASFVAYAMRDAYDRRIQLARADLKQPQPWRLTLSEATSGSYLGHLTVMMTFVLVVILFITPLKQTPQVTQIELIQEKPPEPPRPAPKKESPKPKVEPIKVVQPKPVVQPPKVVQPQPVKVETPLPTPVAAVPAPAPAPAAAPTTGSGSSGGTSSGSGSDGSGSAEVDMGPYMRDLQKRIKAHWYPPKGNEDKRIKVQFKVFKDGHIAKLKLISSSGVSIADDAATQAVSDAQPFAPLPDGVGDDIDINFTFDYHVFGHSSRAF